MGSEPVLTAIPCTLMRGGTSKGLFFHAADLPADRAQRDRVLLAAMGSPDARQIDGVGGAHPLTSKVAVVSRSAGQRADVDYLFLQVSVDKAEVSDSQNCGNLLAAVAPWSIENGLVTPASAATHVGIRMLNTGTFATARVETPGGKVEYEGDARIDGVPGTAAPITLEFADVAGGSCGALLPTGAARDHIEGFDVTCIDNGMPVVILRGADFGVSGVESPAQLEANATLVARIEALRLALGPRMNLGDVRHKTVPKMCLVSPPREKGAIRTATFIPHRVHEAIGVLGAVSVATACMVPGSVAAEVARLNAGQYTLDVEHPSGFFTVDVQIHADASGQLQSRRAALLRTARKLMRGEVFVPGSLWSGA